MHPVSRLLLFLAALLLTSTPLSILRAQESGDQDPAEPELEFEDDAAASLNAEFDRFRALFSQSALLTDFLEIEPEDAGAVCPGLRVTRLGPAAGLQGKAQCEFGGNRLLTGKGEFQIDHPGPLPQGVREIYTRVDVTLRLTPLDNGQSQVEILADASQRRRPEARACVQLFDRDSGFSLSGYPVRFYQRYKIVAEGLSDEKGRFCADELRAGPLVAATNGGERYLDRAIRLDADGTPAPLALEALRTLSCKLEDPHAFRKRHAEAKFFFQPVESRPSTTLAPGSLLSWQNGARESRDTLEFEVFDTHFSRPEGIDPDERVEVLYGIPDDFVLRFPFKPGAAEQRPADRPSVDGCRLSLPAPAPRDYRLALQCPAGLYLPPGTTLLLKNQRREPVAPPAPVPEAKSEAKSEAKPEAAAAGQELKPAVAAVAATPAPIPPAEIAPVELPFAGEYSAFRTLRLADNEISRSQSLRIRFATTDAPTIRWQGMGGPECKTEDVPFTPDENGQMIFNPGGCCVARDIAVRLENLHRDWAARRAENEVESPEGASAGDCAEDLPITLPEREALRRALENGKAPGCRAIGELSELSPPARIVAYKDIALP